MKQVRFCTKVRVRKYSKDEAPKSKWYTQQELDRIDQEIETTVMLMRMNTKSVITRKLCHQEIQRILHESDEDGYYCSRGLEYRIPYLGAHRSQNKKLAREAILDEQRLIFQNNQASLSPGRRGDSSDSNDDFAERLSKVYQTYSHGCHEDAAMRGAMDERVAKKINHENDECCCFLEIGPSTTQEQQGQPNDRATSNNNSNERWHNGGPSDTAYDKSQIRRRFIPQLDFKKSVQKDATPPPAK